MFQLTPFSDSSFIVNNIDTTPKYIQNYLKNKKELNEELTMREDIRSRLSNISKEYKEAKPIYMIEQENHTNRQTFFLNNLLRIKNLYTNPLSHFQEDKSNYILKKDIMPYEKKDMNFERKIHTYNNIKYRKKLEQEYEKIAIKPNYNEKYIFVALHYQPEETSIPTGGLYGTQALIIELLHSFLSTEYKIYIKEHKTQLNYSYQGAMGRNLNFYQEILNISDRVQFVPVDEDPFLLIDNAVVTATISGTIGWESIIRGTPTIVFGRAWYEDMIGVFKIKSLDDLNNNWNEILLLKNNISFDKIEEYHRKMQTFFIEASHYKAFQHRYNRTSSESCFNIVNGIENHLNRVDFFRKI
ncbi:MAG TPA: hypothetical protein ENK66_04470 [Arcobacter sp.]|nr:hypothetical protein [Arcobacter sp.]